ncbi:7796_t:CDS:2 [Diversispora eburnea]|uniref:7796_t:CDS:1 n=1 Tax=Diversispora eburnea TaxID=1213867 RepID=A0A9N8YIS7_9GLOM|nr:7796_t:CDS:2 [Diversispora eburnea]
MNFLGLNNKNKTFKPKKNVPEGTKQYDLQKYAEATLCSGNLKLAVVLPDGEDINEWLAVNKYIDNLMEWVQNQLNDENLFPSKIGVPFPKNFQSSVKVIFKRLFRVYAHIYLSHFPAIIALGEEAHLNTSFKHFIYFVQEFQLIEKKELQPLTELIVTLTSKDQNI